MAYLQSQKKVNKGQEWSGEFESLLKGFLQVGTKFTLQFWS